VLLAEGMLFFVLVKAEAGLLWHNDRTGTKPELEPGCFGSFVVERVRGRMENTDCELIANALCGLLLWTIIATEAIWNFAPSFLWT
jgi:hypothetical protein